MPKSYKPVDLNRVTTYPLKDRKNKVRVEAFAKAPISGTKMEDFFEGLPKILAAKDLLALASDIILAHRKRKPIIAMLGAHVIKCGLSPIIISLMEKDIITAIALNGAGAIHDFEVALIGQTSEDVELNIQSGKFGMADETGRLMNEAIIKGAKRGLGMGQALSKFLVKLKPTYLKYSVLAASERLSIPLTVHVAIGTDIIHQHPSADGAAYGQTSFEDFKLLTSVVSDLGGGGVVLNFGSAVILPEVFLKALTIARNLGSEVKDFTAANFDMIQHYRPLENVLKRPTRMGGRAYSFVGHHEIMIPLLAQAVLKSKGEGRSLKD